MIFSSSFLYISCIQCKLFFVYVGVCVCVWAATFTPMKLVVSSYQQLKFAWILFVWTKNTRQKSPRSADEKMLVKCSFTKIVIENSSTSHALRDGECTTIRRNRTPFNTKMKIKEIKLPHIFFLCLFFSIQYNFYDYNLFLVQKFTAHWMCQINDEILFEHQSHDSVVVCFREEKCNFEISSL